MPSSPRQISVTREFEDGIELNWLPPTDPNGEVHYVIYYTPEGGTEQNSSTGSNLTHYNLTGLERNRVYTNITVQTVNSAGRSDRSAVIAQYNHEQPGECSCTCMGYVFKALFLKNSYSTLNPIQIFRYIRNFCGKHNCSDMSSNMH